MKRILCVDDIQTNLFILEALFESNYSEKEFEVVTALSGKEALNILLAEQIDLIFLDIMMPEMDGYETAKLILSNRKTKSIPIIFLTAKKDEDTVSKCYEVGGSDYISKPYNDKELFSRMNFHLELIEKKRKLEEEKKFTQAILDTQKNMIFISDGSNIIRLNKSVKDFFQIKNYKEFRDKFDCICKTFAHKEGYFSLSDVDDGQMWVDVLFKKLEEGNVLVCIKNQQTKKEQTFDIKIEKFEHNYLINMTDVTSIDKELKFHKYEAFHDKLTGIFNRAKFNEILDEFLNRALEERVKFTLVMFDIDHFKNVNDTFGHLVGDYVLISLTNIVSHHIRTTDIFARWGGEEFVLILQNTSLENATQVAELLRAKIEESTFEQVGKITCSFGVSEHREAESSKTLLARVDEALYEAKESGRNRVVVK